MLGNQDYPGVMFYTMMELYRRIDELKDDKICEVAVSYCEVRRGEREREGREREREEDGGRERCQFGSLILFLNPITCVAKISINTHTHVPHS